MRKLLTVALSVSVLWGIALCAALAFGRSQPLHVSATRMHFTDCAWPCWMGITLGQTTLQEVEALFGKQSGFISLDFPNKGLLTEYAFSVPAIGSSGRPITITGQGFLQNDRVVEMKILAPITDSPYSELPHLGDLMTLFGRPACIYIGTFQRRQTNPLRHVYWLDFTSVGGNVTTVEIAGSDSDLLGQSIETVNWRISDGNGDQGCHNPRFPGQQPWRGFASLSRYLARP